MTATAQSEVGAIGRLLLKHARDAFGSPEAIAEQWKLLNFSAPPDFDKAIRQYDRFVALLAEEGASLDYVPASAGTFPTHGPLFVGLLVGVILIIGGLTFFPALALGPIAEHFAMQAKLLY